MTGTTNGKEKLVNDEVLQYLVRALGVTLPAGCTGQAKVLINYHDGIACSWVAGFEQGGKFKAMT